MNRNETIEIYNSRIERATEFIARNLDREMELTDIAAVAGFSPFHFHRIFRAFRGEPLGAYVTRLRVEAAARLLRHSDRPVETIAYNVGFDVPSSLTKAFRRFYKITPSEYRSGKNINIMKTSQVKQTAPLRAPNIVELEPKTVVCVSFTGDYKKLDYPGAFARLWALVKKQGLFGGEIEHLGVFYNDPKVTDTADLRTDVCLAVHRPAVAEDGISVKTIAGGRYAVFTHVGPYNEVQALYNAIYGEWVPAHCDCEDCTCGGNCTCSLRDAPVFEKYLNDPDSVAPEKLETEIYLPIK